MLSVPRFSRYERALDHSPGDPNIYVHKATIQAMGGTPPTVDYASQLLLHNVEIPNLVGLRRRPPTVFIDRVKTDKLEPTRTPMNAKKLSAESSASHRGIHVSPRTFIWGGVETFTEASEVRLAREIILQSAARAIESRGGQLTWREVRNNHWLAPAVGVVVFGATSLVGSTEAGVVAGALVGSGIQLMNSRGQEKIVRSRIHPEARIVAGRLIGGHRQDISIPGVVRP